MILIKFLIYLLKYNKNMKIFIEIEKPYNSKNEVIILLDKVLKNLI